MEGGREPDAGPRLVERARARLGAERAGCAVGKPPRQVESTRRVRGRASPGGDVPVLGRESKRETCLGPERVDPAESGEGRELAIQTRRRLGAPEAIGRLGPAAGEEKKGETILRACEPRGAEREDLPAPPSAREAWLRRGKPDAGRVQREHRAESTSRDRTSEQPRRAPGSARRRDRALRPVRDHGTAEADRCRPGRQGRRCPSTGSGPSKPSQAVLELEHFGPPEAAQTGVRRRGHPRAGHHGERGRKEGARVGGEAKPVDRVLSLEPKRLEECPRDRGW